MPAATPGRLRILVAAAALLIACVALVPPAARTYRAVASQLRPVVRSLTRTTFEERRRATYGDCGGLGYGYVTEVLRAYPDQRSRPLIKWPDAARSIALVLPGSRSTVDDRVLIGIDLAEGHFAPRAISAARPQGEQRDGARVLSRWAFSTDVDYDLLTGFALEFRAPPASSAEYEITLIHSLNHPRVIGRWTAKAPPGQERFLHVLPAPVSGFSYGRGATDFIVEIGRPSDGPEPVRLIPVGTNVDGRGYVVVHRRGRCLTAVRSELLATAESDGGWRHFIEALADAR